MKSEMQILRFYLMGRNSDQLPRIGVTPSPESVFKNAHYSFLCVSLCPWIGSWVSNRYQCWSDHIPTQLPHQSAEFLFVPLWPLLLVLVAFCYNHPWTTGGGRGGRGGACPLPKIFSKGDVPSPHKILRRKKNTREKSLKEKKNQEMLSRNFFHRQKTNGPKPMRFRWSNPP